MKNMKPVVSLVTIVLVLESVTGVTPGMCPSGFVQCTNGACEPYTDLCGQFTPKPSPTTTSMVPSSTTEGTLSPTPTIATTVWSTTTEGTLSPPTDVTTVTPFTSTTYSGPEICPIGFEKCRDGKCEPFHYLCEKNIPDNPTGVTPSMCPSGFVQCTNGACESYTDLCGQFTPKPSPTTTSMVPSSTTEGTLSPTPTIATTVWSTTTEGTLSPPTDVTTVTPFTSTTYSGPEICPIGFEKCRDGKCEPFHFLCEEHITANPAGTVLG